MVPISLILEYLPCCFCSSFYLHFLRGCIFLFWGPTLANGFARPLETCCWTPGCFSYRAPFTSSSSFYGCGWTVGHAGRLRMRWRHLRCATPPKWLGVLSKHLWNLYRLGLIQDFPFAMPFKISSNLSLEFIIFCFDCKASFKQPFFI